MNWSCMQQGCVGSAEAGFDRDATRNKSVKSWTREMSRSDIIRYINKVGKVYTARNPAKHEKHHSGSWEIIH